jgi:ferredoxin-NADP reductase
VLPKDNTKKLVFIAGGIGITPFRSMIKYLSDTGDSRAVTLLYSARTEGDIAYRSVFDEAQRTIGLKTIYALTGNATPLTLPNSVAGKVTAELVERVIPDYNECIYYISGTNPMVEAMKDMLAGMGVPHSQIKVDFFPGYAHKAVIASKS